MANKKKPIDPQTARAIRMRRRKRHRMVFRILCVLIVCAAAILASTVFFRVSVITVSGDTRYDRDELIQTSGVIEGDNLFFLRGKGIVRSLSILIGLIVGYVVALCMGMVSFDALHDVPAISLPRILPFTPEFHLDAILAIVCVYLVSATETIGDTSAICSGALGREVQKKEMGASVACDGFVSSVAGLFGCTPITSFSQNVGLAALTKVVNRFAIATGAIILILSGFVPAIGAILATIPQAVLGGCTIMMFGSIVFASFGMMARCGFSQRNMIIVSLSLAIGLGFTSVPAIFDIFPQLVRTVFAQNSVALVFLIAVVLNLVLPKEKEEKVG